MPDIELLINIEGTGFCNREELNVRWKMQELIEDRGIGKVTGAGTGQGQMDIGVEVEEVNAATSKLRALAQELGVHDIEIVG